MDVSRIYKRISGNRTVGAFIFALLTVISICLSLRLSFSEDISDFLPLGTAEREWLSVYQNISGAEDMFIIFEGGDDPDCMVSAIDRFADLVSENDAEGWCSSLVTCIDMETVQSVPDFVYDNIPLFLTHEDYSRMDSLLSDESFIPRMLQKDREMLSLPSGSMTAGVIAKDPLGLYAPVLSKLGTNGGWPNFEFYDSHIFTPDMSRAIAMMVSPFGNSETENNLKLIALLEDCINLTEIECSGIHAHVVGGPAIAVGNASRIKKDSITAIVLSLILILALLYYSFRSVRNIALIALSIAWGWLFALGGMALFSDSVSIIVIGISSVILGIAVNYPLHLIAHSCHQPDMTTTLKEVSGPLIIGSITTIGAFLALIPLKSTALKDLGSFASLLLAGTIIFVLIFLPHLVKTTKLNTERKAMVFDRIAIKSIGSSKAVILCIVALSLILGYFSTGISFDSDLSNINYLTPEQKSDLEYFSKLVTSNSSGSGRDLYLISSGDSLDEALEKNEKKEDALNVLIEEGSVTSHSPLSQFVASQARRTERLSMWKAFTEKHKADFGDEMAKSAANEGFSEQAFVPFLNMVSSYQDSTTEGPEFFNPLMQSVFKRNFTTLRENGKFYVIDILKADADKCGRVKSALDGCFSTSEINGAVSSSLSDNFNYIGIACSLIVFLFLWFSFGSIELALISFIPMAVSWIWILGIMAIVGTKFNIVNIILATFIFGQGDDYTIFMTEGCQYEYARRKPILASYRSSIMQSALIMFFGIGTLITARHPAMHSLAQITIIGMFSVVLMAYIIPPFLFKWLTTSGGRTRKTPVTLLSLLHIERNDAASLVIGRYRYKGKEIFSSVKKSMKTCDKIVSSELLDGSIFVSDGNYGENAIYIALTHPGLKVIAEMNDKERMEIAQISAEGFADNLNFILKQ